MQSSQINKEVVLYKQPTLFKKAAYNFRETSLDIIEHNTKNHLAAIFTLKKKYICVQNNNVAEPPLKNLILKQILYDLFCYELKRDYYKQLACSIKKSTKNHC